MNFKSVNRCSNQTSYSCSFLKITTFIAVHLRLRGALGQVDQVSLAVAMDQDRSAPDPAFVALVEWASPTSPTSASTSRARSESAPTPSTLTAGAAATPSTSTSKSGSTSSGAATPTTSTAGAAATLPTASTTSPATVSGATIVIVEDEVRREHGIKGSLDAKVKGTSLPSIAVSLSWNNSSTVTTTSKKTLPPSQLYPNLPVVDPTPAVPYPQPGLPSVPVSNTGTISVRPIPGPSQTSAVRRSSGAPTSTSSTSGPRPDSGLGTSESEYQSGFDASDSENAAYRTCMESSDQSDSDEPMSPSAPTDDDDSDVDDAPDATSVPLHAAQPHQPLQVVQQPQARAGNPVGHQLSAATPVSQAQAGLPSHPVQVLQPTQGGAQDAGQQPQAGPQAAPQAGASGVVGRGRGAGQGRDRGNRARGRRQRRVRKREWEQSEEELSPVDDEAGFPSRISPRNKKPYEGYSRF